MPKIEQRNISSIPKKIQPKQNKDNYRKKSVRVKNMRGRKVSSQHWLQRQVNDPYVQMARQSGYRSRAAFKLLEIQEKFSLISQNMRLVDLGAAPGSWLQVAKEIISKQGSKKIENQIFGIDLLDITPIADINFLHGDFLNLEIQQQLHSNVKSDIDIVLSDMAANTTGISTVDQLRTNFLAEQAFYFSKEVLNKGGSFVAKVFTGGTHSELLNELKKHFASVKHFKPSASRSKSPEMYVICQDFLNINHDSSE